MDKISSLKKLKGLLEEGIITEEEFQRQKKIILEGVVREPEKLTSGFVPEADKDANLSPEQLPDNNPDVPTEDNIPSPAIDNDDVYDDVVSKTEQVKSLLLPEPVTEEKSEMTEEEKEAERIKESKARLWAGIIVCFLGIVIGVIYLLTDNIVDRLVKYEKAGFAILQFEKSGSSPHIIAMNKKGLYYDNKFTVTEILPVGKELNTREIRLHYDANGLKATADDADKKFAMTSSRGLYAMRLANNVYLLSTKQLTNNPLIASGLSVESSYLIIKNDKSKEVKVYKIPKSKTDGNGHVQWTLSRNILEQYEPYFKSAFSKDDYKKIVERKYGQYSATIDLSLKSGEVQIDDPINFYMLVESYPAKEVGTLAHSSSMRETIHRIFRTELEESFYSNASQLTGVSNRNYMKITENDKYTFVINPIYRSGDQPKGLFRVDNKKREVTFIDYGKDIQFLSSSICVTKIETFLLFFDSEKNIYYDYNGYRKN